MLFISFAIFAVAGLKATHSTTPAIKDGDVVNGALVREKYGTFVAALRNDSDFVCPAAIIEANIAVTSADCAKKLTDDDGELLEGNLTLTAGITERDVGDVSEETNLQIIDIKKIIIHPDFGKDGTYDNDIAKVILDSDLKLCETVQPIKLGEEDVFQDVDVVGWGIDMDKKEFTEMEFAMTLIEDKEVCEIVFQDENITECVMCATTDNCFKSGSPMVVYSNDKPEDSTLVGVALEIEEGKCDPFIYTSVPQLREWILEKAE